MIPIKTAEEIAAMRKSCELAAKILQFIEPYVKVGMTTDELNLLCEDFTRSHGAISAPLGYRGYPKSICTSINEVVCHGIPSAERVLKNGDIVNIDVTPILNGWHGDTNKTFFVGEPNERAKRLVDVAKRALEVGMEAIRAGERLNVIGDAIEPFVRRNSCNVVRALGGHGIGKSFHEEPFVPHNKVKNKLPYLREGMIFTVEPMINEGTWDVFFDTKDNWTVWSKDGKLSAQFEHTILVTASGYEILTQI